MKKSTEAGRPLAWIVVALLLVPSAGRAAGLHDLSICERDQPGQQRGGHPPGDAPKGDKAGDKGPDHTPKWWIDPKLRAELGITDPQSAAVEQIWQKSLPALREGRQRLEKLEDALSQMTDVADEAVVFAQIEKVENLRAELSKGRTLMIYRMNKILTPDQRAKVKAMYARREPPRRGGLSPR
jgi:Spy/CpxP family protein refolding chaperone